LAALAALAAILAVYMRDAAVAGSLREDEIKIEAAERSAVELAALRLGQFRADLTPPRGAFSFALRGAAVDVAFVSETARIDLNGAPKEMLAGFFVALGMDDSSAQATAGAVAAWRTASVDGAEDDADRDADSAYSPRHAPFEDVLELALVRGVTPDLMRRAAPYLTVFNWSGQIDVRVADPVVLSALPQIDPEQLSRLLAARDDPAGFDAAAYVGALGPAAGLATTSGHGQTRLFVAVTLDDGRRASAQIVMTATPRDAQPYRIAAWSEE
jgi:general secretion pathway protein K